jgi:hypothetical protein
LDKDQKGVTMGKRSAIGLILVLVVLGMSPVVLAATTVPAGTTLSVRLVDSLSSAKNKPGDAFAATVDVPVVIDGKTVIARGTRVNGEVVSAAASGRLTTPAKLYVKLVSIEIGGKTYPLRTSLAGRTEKSKAKRDVVAIGGGAAAGAIIGGIAGGGKGAAIGTVAGAGAGTAGAAATGKKDIEYPSEKLLRFTLRTALTVP